MASRSSSASDHRKPAEKPEATLNIGARQIRFPGQNHAEMGFRPYLYEVSDNPLSPKRKPWDVALGGD